METKENKKKEMPVMPVKLALVSDIVVSRILGCTSLEIPQKQSILSMIFSTSYDYQEVQPDILSSSSPKIQL